MCGRCLWLGRGIAGDDTHGHVDDLARFVGPRTIVTVVEGNAADQNHEPLQENLERLGNMTDTDGRKLEIVALPMPKPVIFAGRRLPASYANFYIANEKVLVPTFNDPHDREALGILADLFPKRTVVGIHAVDLVWGLGTLHCMTQQEPLRGKRRLLSFRLPYPTRRWTDYCAGRDVSSAWHPWQVVVASNKRRINDDHSFTRRLGVLCPS